MWERIGQSSLLIIGAIVLFAALTVALFLLERHEDKKVCKTRPLQAPRYVKTDRAA